MTLEINDGLKEMEPFFHDGSISQIKMNENEMLIWAETTELADNEMIPSLVYSKENTLKVILMLSGVKTISINDMPENNLDDDYSNVSILEFVVQKHNLSMLLIWENAFLDNGLTKCKQISINAEKIQWTNISRDVD